MKKYFVYVLQSLVDHGYSVGFTHDLQPRLAEHNAAQTRSLRARRPLRLIYAEEFSRQSEAKARERKIKSYQGGEAFQRWLHLAPVRQRP